MPKYIHNLPKTSALMLLVLSCLVLIYIYLGLSDNLGLATKPHIQSMLRRNHKWLISTVNDELKKRTESTNRSPYIDPISRMCVCNTSSKAEIKHTILHWNAAPWLTGFVPDMDMSLCVYNNCRTSFDRKSFEESSAVIFDLSYHGIGEQPPVNTNDRNPNQAWIFFTLESPVHLSKREVMHPSWQNVFNWSWTYNRKSDIFQPYGIFVSGNKQSAKDYRAIFRTKRKTAAWVVSNCQTQSKREYYVKILQKYIDVDIFGACGKRVPAELKTHLNMNYKFYLSFENSLCEDYVTEKFFHYYKLDIITVVRGANNYSDIFPNGSFLDATTFSSISELAKYIRFLAIHEEEYIRYLKIKDMYKVYEIEFTHQNALCNVCEKLNALDQNKNRIYDALQWLGQCNAPIIT